MKQLLRMSHVSAPRQVLLRLFQRVDYGQILDLVVADREPMFNEDSGEGEH